MICSESRDMVLSRDSEPWLADEEKHNSAGQGRWGKDVLCLCWCALYELLSAIALSLRK